MRVGPSFSPAVTPRQVRSNGSGSALSRILSLALIGWSVACSAAFADLVFWTDRALDVVGRVNSDGTAPTNLVTGLNNPRPLATDGTYLYFGNNGGDPITRVNLDGTGSTTLVNATASGLFVNDSFIYYTQWNGGVWRANKDGTGQTQLITAGASGGQTTGFQAIYVNASTIYFGNYNDGALYSRPLDGGAISTVVAGVDQLTNVSGTAANLYIGSTIGNRGVVKTDLNGGNLTEIGTVGSYIDITVLGDLLYYVNSGNAVGKMNLDGSGQTTLLTSGSGTHGVAAVAVPEPSTYAMALAGLACGGYSMWRRSKRA